MICKPGLRCFHQAESMLRGHDHQMSNNEVIQFHHATQSVLEKLFVLPSDTEFTGIVVEEPSMVALFEELA